MDFKELAEILFPEITETMEDLHVKYPQRQLSEGARVTRFAPSPTGYMHLGGLFQSVIDERLAHQSRGSFFLRIENTDDKREIPGAVDNIIKTLEHYGISFDEGAVEGGETGVYGPYRQRDRENIYKICAKELVKMGRAYPCFCTPEELAEMRKLQETRADRYGYYGRYAVHRDTELDEIKADISAGKSYVLRFRSEGDPEKTVRFRDEIKGSLEFPENDTDFVLLKSDGIPTYHFAHVVDDHFMGTTHVVRSEEWLATLPWHLELTRTLGFRIPRYCHTAQILISDGGGKRKLSKRKDPEASLDFYYEKGYPKKALIDYVLTLINSNFEDWRRANRTADYRDFEVSLKKMSVSGSLFDRDKLLDICKNTLAYMTAEEIYDQALSWSEDHDRKLYELISDKRDYTLSILNIGRGGQKPRKDLTLFTDIYDYISFFFAESFRPDYSYLTSAPEAAALLEAFRGLFREGMAQEEWFGRVKQIAADNGFAPTTAEYKAEPGSFKGHIGDVSMVCRVAVTGRQNSPDLYEIMKIIGSAETEKRLSAALSFLKG